MWHERIARECAESAAERLLAGLHPEEQDQRFAFTRLNVEIAIQQYVHKLQAEHRRLCPLKHERNGRER